MEVSVNGGTVEDYRYWREMENTWTFSKGLCRVPRDYYLNIVKRYETRSFLDLGCGFGETYNLFNRNGVDLRYVGIDVTSNFIDICRARYPDGEFMVGRIQEVPFLNASFELVSSKCVLEHLPDPVPAIREMARISTEVVVIVWFKWPGEGESYRYKKAGYWENKYSRDRMLDVASSVGLRLEDEIPEGRHLAWVLEKVEK